MPTREFYWINLYENVPFVALRPSALTIVTDSLGVLSESKTKDGRLKDWRGLAECLGFSMPMICGYNSQKWPAREMFSDLPETCLELSITELLKHFQTIERFDILRDVRPRIEQDVEAYWRSLDADIVQDATVSSSEHQPGDRLTREDLLEPGVQYDAFVAFGHSTLAVDFVRQMIENLEGKKRLKLFIMERNGLVGTSTYTTTAHLIEKRCRRMVVVLSDDFIRSDECDFQLKFAQALSPGAVERRVIPVTIQKALQRPSILRFMTYCDYTRSDLREWFWERLYDSIVRKDTDDDEDDVRDPDALDSLSLTSSVSWVDLTKLPGDLKYN